MLKRIGGYLAISEDPAPPASEALETRGYAHLKNVFTAGEIAALHAACDEVFDAYPPDGRAAAVRDPDEDNDFRYQMFNRSAVVQQAIAHPTILQTIEPLLGADCHVIANTCWRNPPRLSNTHGGGNWHIDAGPHVPRPAGVPWDDRIPYPVFAIGIHIYLRDCPEACGPTGVIPFSHKSGQAPAPAPDAKLHWQGHGVVALTAAAGDVVMFVSDVWHRRLPSGPGDSGRYFLQVHYGRRDIAQRILPTAEVNHVTDAALGRISSKRERTLLGLHPNFFYDG